MAESSNSSGRRDKKNKKKWGGGQRKQIVEEADLIRNAQELSIRDGDLAADAAEAGAGTGGEARGDRVARQAGLEKATPLTIDVIRQGLVQDDTPAASTLDLGDRGVLSRKQQAFVEAQAKEEELERQIALGLTEEAAADLDRLAEVREQRERAQRRRNLEAKKKEELKQKALQRAAELASKKAKGSKPKKGKKR